MTSNEFLEVTGEIEKFYNVSEDKKLSTEQSRIWFDELKILTKERYRQISRECYKKLKFMPKLADIIEMNNVLANFSAKKDDTVYECNKCDGTGFICYKRIIENYTYDYAARCMCKNGLKISRKIPSIQEIGLMI